MFKNLKLKKTEAVIILTERSQCSPCIEMLVVLLNCSPLQVMPCHIKCWQRKNHLDVDTVCERESL